MMFSLLLILTTLSGPSQQSQASVLDQDREFDKGSVIEIERLSPAQVESLVVLAKVWGFLKYHHPRITAGELHWDYELLRVLPRVLDAQDLEAATATLLEFVEALPPHGNCSPCAAPPEDPYMAAELAWIHDKELLGDELSAQLESVYRNRHVAGEQFYVSLVEGVGNPVFNHELLYPQFKMPDAGFRILALFRYWNIIRYWFPYRDLINADWDAVLAEFLPRLLAARDPDRYRLELIALIARVHDTHANLWSSLEVRPPRGGRQLPVQVRFIEGLPVVVGYSHPDGKASGLHCGDILRSIDGVSIDSLLAEWHPFYAASNEPTRLRDVGRNITRGDKESCRVRVERDGKHLELEVRRLPIDQIDAQSESTHDLPGQAFRMLSPEVG